MIYIFTLFDESGQTNLTNHPNYDYEPAFSPDGSRIVFYRVFFRWSEYGDRIIDNVIILLIQTVGDKQI